MRQADWSYLQPSQTQIIKGILDILKSSSTQNQIPKIETISQIQNNPRVSEIFKNSQEQDEEVKKVDDLKQKD